MQIPDGQEHLILQPSNVPQQQEEQESGHHTLAPDSSSVAHPPSLQPWLGKHGFTTLSLPTDNKDRNKVNVYSIG